LLRPYQQKALDEIRKHYGRNEKKVFLHLATGGGKTVVFCEVLKAVAAKDKHAIMVVRGRKLVDQASKRLDREGVDHGVLMANHWRKRPRAKIQICSIDTMYEREETPPADLVVIDEAHHATSEGYKWLANAYRDAFWLPVSATPYCRGSLRHVADHIVRPITIKELIEQNFLVPPIYYAPSVPDLTGVPISSTGDYVVKALDDILNQTHPIGDIVESWKKYGKNRPTLIFAVSVRHSEAIAKAFNDAGIPAAHIDADNSDQERDEAVNKLDTGDLKVISNVGIFCTGVDIPHLGCLVMARPTKSYSLFIQQAGRGTRIYEGKKDFILIDHGGNVLRHGLITEEREGSLDPMPKGQRPPGDGLTTCFECYAVFERGVKFCPGCGALNEACASVSKDKKALNPIDAELEEADQFHLLVISRRGELKEIAKRRGYKKGWVWFKLKEQFGEEVANKYQPQRQVPDFVRKRLAEQLRRASTNPS
jgi:superfamily II DNA or RNA helicase